MKFKSLSVFLSLLIITVLPFTAYAELTTDDSGSPAVSDYDPPYALATPTQADQGHIATTAYVKGAYNDAITAVNTLNDAVYGEGGLSDAVDSIVSSLDDLSDAVDGKQDRLYAMVHMGRDQDVPVDIPAEVKQSLEDVTIDNKSLVTGYVVKSAINDVNSTIADKRVEIYTTWGSNNTTGVALASASDFE